MKSLDKLYINGKWIASDANSYLEIINSATGQKTGKCISGNAVDVDKAAKLPERRLGTGQQNPLMTSVIYWMIF